ncbi:fasciclin domain-containing protein [Colwellia sp. MB02u-6]|uniref:fasciclin domain-containing protein n=1 Tax=Colwellia sp. MB02u-6 TaxID=2759824 RepID=UPI0015F6B878|nr:fasciclin domain-containing protein [Colwellia sp. MB02u-6]MBA6327075.1 fasciclin domain-containing protein [Colwellia sp. MB02u-6]
MLNKFIAVLSLMVASLAFMPAAFAGHHNEGDHGMKKDIVDVAAENGSFNTLVAAIKAAGLVDTLKGEGPFTVFAPTDEAFAKLPEGTLEMLLEPENKDKLASILTYHVVSGKVMSTDVVKIDSATTVQGQMLMVEVADENVMINNAKVIMADVKASNGVIHVIDTVLMPK